MFVTLDQLMCEPCAEQVLNTYEWPSAAPFTPSACPECLDRSERHVGKQYRTTRLDPDSYRLCCAWHEAGHARLALAHGIDFEHESYAPAGIQL